MLDTRIREHKRKLKVEDVIRVPEVTDGRRHNWK
jgi:hypothetical protein